MLRVIWLSANLLGYELLKEALKVKGLKIVGIITLSDKAKTRMYDGIDKKKWNIFNLSVYEIEDINKEISLLKSLNPDVIIMCGWRQILNKDVLDVAPIGVIGFHPTLLPRGRGPAPIINTILEGLKESGVTMLYINEGLDSGDIIGQEQFKIDKDDYAIDIYNKVINAGRTLIRRYLPLLTQGKAPRIPQSGSEVTYFKKRSLKDNMILLDQESPEQIYKKIRALSKPYRGAYIKIGNKKLIIWKAELHKIKKKNKR
jgi:methionyl-tRNA formyltransferase